MSDSTSPAAFRSRTSWDVEIGRFRFVVTRTREAQAASPAPRGFAAGALAGVGAVGLLVVGASATPTPITTERYMVSVPVPASARLAPRPERRVTAARPAARKPEPAVPTGERFASADEPYVARAMATGAFQQWEGGDGLPRFLTAGPARAVGGGHCRDLALLVRLADGGSRVRSAERCTTGPVSDAAPELIDEGSGGADE